MSQSDYIDASTGIHNRHFLEEQSTEIILYQKFKKQSFSLILADIDCCKIQNDLYGYKAVDFRIQKIAHIIANCVHVSKIDHVLVRWAGDQFLLVLLNTDENEAVTIVRLIQNQIYHLGIIWDKSAVLEVIMRMSLPDFNNISDRVSLSYGITTIVPELNQSWESCVRLADKAMYQAKLAGRNCYVVLNDEKKLKS